MIGVFLSSPTNSTFFTSCCSVAICDRESACPQCKRLVYPFSEGMSADERESYSDAHDHSVGKARWLSVRGGLL